MKKTIIALLIAGVMSCQNEIIPDIQTLVTFEKVEINDLPLITQRFVPLAEVAWDITQDDEMRGVVYSKVKDKFDGDFNVLFKDILDSKPYSRNEYSDLAIKVQNGILNFQLLSEDEIIYPQIFIPFYDELMEKNLIRKQRPVLVFRDGPPSEDGLYDGYEFFENNLYLIGKISEDYARSNEVWVISTNERVDENGELLVAYTNDDVVSGRLNSAATPKIVNAVIKGKSCMKEDWIGGAADVWIQRHFEDTWSYPMVGEYYGNASKQYAAEVVKISRKDAKKWTVKYPNFSIISNWNDPNYSIYNRCSFVIFEYDPVPAGTHYVDMGQFNLYYRSYEGYFVVDDLYYAGSTFSYTSCFESNIY